MLILSDFAPTSASVPVTTEVEKYGALPASTWNGCVLSKSNNAVSSAITLTENEKETRKIVNARKIDVTFFKKTPTLIYHFKRFIFTSSLLTVSLINLS